MIGWISGRASTRMANPSRNVPSAIKATRLMMTTAVAEAPRPISQSDKTVGMPDRAMKGVKTKAPINM